MVRFIVLGLLDTFISVISILFLVNSAFYLKRMNDRMNSYNKLPLSKEEEKELKYMKIKYNLFIVSCFVVVLAVMITFGVTLPYIFDIMAERIVNSLGDLA
jgi:hypothetical protein